MEKHFKNVEKFQQHKISDVAETVDEFFRPGGGLKPHLYYIGTFKDRPICFAQKIIRASFWFKTTDSIIYIYSITSI